MTMLLARNKALMRTGEVQINASFDAYSSSLFLICWRFSSLAWLYKSLQRMLVWNFCS